MKVEAPRLIKLICNQQIIGVHVVLVELDDVGGARTRPDIFRVVLGACTQYCNCEASKKAI